MLNLEFNFGLVFEKFLLQEDFENQLSEAEDVFRWDTVDYKSKAIVNRIAQKPQNHMAVISICFRYRIEEYNKRDMEQSELLNAFEHLALLVASAFVAFPQLAMVQDAHLLCNGCHYYMGTKESIYWPGGFLIEAPNGEQWKTTLSWMVLADQNPKLKFIPLFRNAIFLELYEQLHTAVSALEQAYVPEEKCIRERLKNRIPRIVPTADGERIKEMYSFIGKSKNMLYRLAEHKAGITYKKEHKYEIMREARLHGYNIKFDVLYYAKSKQLAALTEELGSKEGEYIR